MERLLPQSSVRILALTHLLTCSQIWAICADRMKAASRASRDTVSPASTMTLAYLGWHMHGCPEDELHKCSPLTGQMVECMQPASIGRRG